MTQRSQGPYAVLGAVLANVKYMALLPRRQDCKEMIKAVGKTAEKWLSHWGGRGKVKVAIVAQRKGSIPKRQRLPNLSYSFIFSVIFIYFNISYWCIFIYSKEFLARSSVIAKIHVLRSCNTADLSIIDLNLKSSCWVWAYFAILPLLWPVRSESLYLIIFSSLNWLLQIWNKNDLFPSLSMRRSFVNMS